MPPQYQSPSVADTSFADGVMHDSLPPRWVRWVLRGWGSVLFVVSFLALIATSGLLLSILNGELFGISNPILNVIIVFTVAMVSLLQLWYAYSLVKLHRWVILPSVLLAFISVVVTYQTFNLPNVDGSYLSNVLAVLSSLCFISIACILLLYRRTLQAKRFDGWLRVLFTITLAPYLVFAVASLVVRDIPTVDDLDLQLEPVTVVPAEDNIYYAVPDLEAVEEETAKAIDRLTGRNSDDLSEFLASSTLQADLALPGVQRVLREFLQATQLPHYQCPTSVNNYSYDAELCALNAYRRLGTLTNLEAIRLLQSGQPLKASEYINASLYLAHQLHSDQKTLIEYLVGSAVYSTTHETLDFLLPTVAHQAATSKSFAPTVVAALAEYRPQRDGLVNAVKKEYLIFKGLTDDTTALQSEFGEEIPTSYFYHPNRTAQEQAHLTRLSIEHITSTCGSDTGLPEVTDQMVKDFRLIDPIDFVLPNIIGKVLLSVTTASFIDTRDRYCEAAERHEKLLEQYRELSERNRTNSTSTI